MLIDNNLVDKSRLSLHIFDSYNVSEAFKKHYHSIYVSYRIYLSLVFSIIYIIEIDEFRRSANEAILPQWFEVTVPDEFASCLDEIMKICVSRKDIESLSKILLEHEILIEETRKKILLITKKI